MRLVNLAPRNLFTDPILHVILNDDATLCGLARVKHDNTNLVQGDKEFSGAGEDSIKNLCSHCLLKVIQS
jgi:hypothetical protein